jgi:hypothetical protein
MKYFCAVRLLRLHLLVRNLYSYSKKAETHRLILNCESSPHTSQAVRELDSSRHRPQQ